jgi:hypothetical protein
VKWEGEGGVKRQLQELREGHGRHGGRGGGGVALPRGDAKTLCLRVIFFGVKRNMTQSCRVVVIVAGSIVIRHQTQPQSPPPSPSAAAKTLLLKFGVGVE